MTTDDIIEMCAKQAEGFGPSRPIESRHPDARVIGRWEGEQAASSGIASHIRALKGTIPGIVREEERAAWQWLDTATFRKHMPKQSNPAEWNPLYRAKKEATK